MMQLSTQAVYGFVLSLSNTMIAFFCCIVNTAHSKGWVYTDCSQQPSSNVRKINSSQTLRSRDLQTSETRRLWAMVSEVSITYLDYNYDYKFTLMWHAQQGVKQCLCVFWLKKKHFEQGSQQSYTQRKTITLKHDISQGSSFAVISATSYYQFLGSTPFKIVRSSQHVTLFTMVNNPNTRKHRHTRTLAHVCNKEAHEVSIPTMNIKCDYAINPQVSDC